MNERQAHFPYIPESLKRLADLSYNLWFSWHSRAFWLFRHLDTKLWEDVYHNPVKLLHQIDPGRLKEVAEDQCYIDQVQSVITAFDHYMSEKYDSESWFCQKHPQYTEGPVAYFSMEFGIHECLPIYSGGLGILAGDHLKSASDLGLPMVGVGLLYRESYFTQFVSPNGHQQAVHLHNDFSTMALKPVKDKHGEDLIVHLHLDHRVVAIKVWCAHIGRIPLFLLDTDFPENEAENREITKRLYVSDRDLRLIQEILLGIGGVIALHAMEIFPSVWHMNEGHSGFLGLERIRFKMEEGYTFNEAKDQIRQSMVFTTHTPVPAGNEVFPGDRVEHFLKSYWESMGISKDQLFELAQVKESDDPNAFNMTMLAHRLSRKANAVSELHGEVARRMWHPLWPDRELKDVPIETITNGIHSRTWIMHQMKDLFDEHLGVIWRDELSNAEFWNKILKIPDRSLWDTHEALRSELIHRVRQILTTQIERNGESIDAIAAAKQILDPKVLTIGFARRFAPYKRSTLIFHDRERLRQIVTREGHPVQILFAGKAHPANQTGKALIQHIYGESRNPEFQNRIVFVENYDMALARRMVSGVDIWLNTPRRPNEACGTSGMKVAANGGLNLSILDGWWREGYNGNNGWAIGEDCEYYNEYEQDWADSQSLYDVLENEVIPAFYHRDDQGLPSRWIQMMKESMRSLIPVFNTCRMVKDYVERMYESTL